jgi:hypothetical protein
MSTSSYASRFSFANLVIPALAAFGRLWFQFLTLTPKYSLGFQMLGNFIGGELLRTHDRSGVNTPHSWYG